MTTAAVTLHDENTPSSNKRVYEAKRNGLDIDIFAGWHSKTLMRNKAFKLFYLVINFFLRSYQVLYIVLSNEYETVLIHKKFYQIPFVLKGYTSILARSHNIIFDLDDAIFLHWWDYGVTEWMIRNADVVTVGSEFLHEKARKHNEDVRKVPTAVDHRMFHPQKRNNKNDTHVIGWVGSGPSHSENLALVANPIKKLLRHNQHYRLEIIGVMGDVRIKSLFKTDDIKGQVNLVERVPHQQVPDRINNFDVGIMPLRETPWERGKCALKALEYMACSVATVASDVGENSEVIEHGKNGFLAKSAEDWINHIKTLTEDKLREEVGQKGRETIENRYTIDQFVSSMKDTIKKVQDCSNGS